MTKPLSQHRFIAKTVCRDGFMPYSYYCKWTQPEFELGSLIPFSLLTTTSLPYIYRDIYVWVVMYNIRKWWRGGTLLAPKSQTCYAHQTTNKAIINSTYFQFNQLWYLVLENGNFDGFVERGAKKKKKIHKAKLTRGQK